MERPIQFRNMEKLECMIVYQSIPYSGYSGSRLNPTLTFSAILWASVTTEFLNNERWHNYILKMPGKSIGVGS